MRTFYKQVVINHTALASFNAPSTLLKNIYMCSVCMISSGSVNGTAKLQASNDPETNDTQTNSTTGTPPTQSPTNWADITNSSVTVNSTSAAPILWNVDAIGFNYIRMVWTDSSSGAANGTITVQVVGKGV